MVYNWRRYGCIFSAGFCIAIASCDPIIFRGIAVTPAPKVVGDSAMSTAVFASIARLAQRHGLTPTTLEGRQEVEHWHQCFSGQRMILCGKQKELTIQVLMEMPGAIHFSALADSIRKEVIDSLQAEFEGLTAHECNWVYKHDSRESGCL